MKRHAIGTADLFRWYLSAEQMVHEMCRLLWQDARLAASRFLFRRWAWLGHVAARYRNFLQAFDEPSACGPGGRFGLPHRRHGQDQTARRYILYGQYREAAFFQILAHDVQGHAAPAEAVEQKVVLREEIGET